MANDTYSKAVLTIIAVCLLLLVAKEVQLVPVAHADNSGYGYMTVPINDDGSINVRFDQSQVVDVRLRGIDEAPSLRWEAINVRVSN